eukprot:762854-Hanusia_phi.AAC.1
MKRCKHVAGDPWSFAVQKGRWVDPLRGGDPLLAKRSLTGPCPQHACRQCKARLASFEQEPLLKFLERHLEQQASRSEYGSKVGILARANQAWKAELEKAGGVKRFCLDNSHKLQYRSVNGSEVVLLVDTQSIKQGDCVKVKQGIEAPTNGWGEVHSWSIGVVTKSINGIVHVDFPEQSSWIGNTHELELVPSEQVAAFSRPPEDARFADARFVKFSSSGVLFEGAQASEEQHTKVGYVRARQACDRDHAYLEVTLVRRAGDGRGSLVVGLTDKSHVPGKVAGEAYGSIGMSEAGTLLLQNKTDLGSSRLLGEGERMGCGIRFEEDGAKTVFFTVNGEETVRVPWTDNVDHVYPVVCSSSEDLLLVDLEATPPPFAPSCVLISQHVEVWDSSSNQWLTARVVGPQSTSGTPVIIQGKSSAVERVQRVRDGDALTEARTEFASLWWAVRTLRTSDRILVKSNSPREFDKSAILIDRGCCIAGESPHTRYHIASDASNAIVVAAEGVELRSLDLSISLDGARDCPEKVCSGVWLTSGGLRMSHVSVSCAYGSAVLVEASFDMHECKIGPCKGHGLVLNEVQEQVVVQDSTIAGCDGSAIKCTRVNGSVEGCSLINCGDGLVLNDCNIDIRNSAITACNRNAVQACSHDRSTACKVVIDTCVIEECFCPILAQGDQLHVLVSSCQVRECQRPAESRSGAIIEMSTHSAADFTPTHARPHTNSQQDNFKRFCKLLLGLGRDVLAQVLQACYKDASKKSWSQGAGEEIAKRLDDYSQRRLGKAMMAKLRSEGIESWDMTLLTSLLTFNPGYIKDEEGVAAVESLRKERNELAHSNTFHLQEMEQEEFDRRWKCVRLCLDVLISQFLPHDKLKLDEQIDAIAADQSELRDVADQIHGSRAALGIPHALQQRIALGNEWFTLISKAGAGGMGAVYVASKDGTDDKYALKVCHNSDGDRQDREAVILQRLMSLKHPNIVRFLGSSYVNNRLFLLMELVQGVTLDVWLERKGLVSLKDSKKVMLQFADGMSAVHSHFIAHRDLKPSNLMLDDVTGNLVIVDFGLSKQLNANMTVTSGTSIIGTAMYMSPEQLEGATSAIDLRSDVWAMGVICYEIVAGCTPFQQPSQEGRGRTSRNPPNLILSKADETRILSAIMTSPMPELPADVAPAPFQRLVRRALEKRQEKRQADANEFGRELAAAFDEIDNGEEGGGPAGQPAGQPARSVAELSVDEVSRIFRLCGFSDAAMAIERNGVDGKTLLSLDDEDWKSSIKDGGLGLGRLQVKRIRTEMERLRG